MAPKRNWSCSSRINPFTTMVVVESSNEFAQLAARNIPNVTIVDETQVTVLDVVNNDKLVLTQAALSKVEEGLQ